MTKLLLVNTAGRRSSIARHLADIAAEGSRRGWHVTTAAADVDNDDSHIRIGSRTDHIFHALATRLADRHGLASKQATEAFIRKAQMLNPDIIHLHNIHGYYLHYPTLFHWLRGCGKRIFWTFHDLWPLTGHCAFPDTANCRLHLNAACRNCPCRREYPAALIADRSVQNLRDKTEAFSHIPRLTLLPVSSWADSELAQSFLSPYPRHVVGIDVDTDIFHPDGSTPARRVLGVANVWDRRKDLPFFGKLRQHLPDDVEICVAGEIRVKLPHGVRHIGMANNAHEMAALYRSATVFVNPTVADNLPLTNREALCCGTPTVSRRIGGCAEGLEAPGTPFKAAVDDNALIDAIQEFLNADNDTRARAAAFGHSLYRSRPNLRRLFNIYTGNNHDTPQNH